jgi:hypothetical protein
MDHLVFHFLLRPVVYPLLYWIGYLVVTTASVCRANILELGESDDLIWNQLRVKRDGFTYWPPESVILAGGSALLAIIGAYLLLILKPSEPTQLPEPSTQRSSTIE